MPTSNIDHQTKPRESGTHALAAAAAELEDAALDAVASATHSQAAADHVEAGVNRAATAVRSGASAVRRGARGIAARLPATVRAARAGAQWTMTALHTLPDQTLRSLAATSMGLGAGLSFTRAGRLGTVVGMVPAMVMETAIAVRPVAPGVPEVATK
jgi:hypothetical protein